MSARLDICINNSDVWCVCLTLCEIFNKETRLLDGVAIFSGCINEPRLSIWESSLHVGATIKCHVMYNHKAMILCGYNLHMCVVCRVSLYIACGSATWSAVQWDGVSAVHQRPTQRGQHRRYNGRISHTSNSM